MRFELLDEPLYIQESKQMYQINYATTNKAHDAEYEMPKLEKKLDKTGVRDVEEF